MSRRAMLSATTVASAVAVVGPVPAAEGTTASGVGEAVRTWRGSTTANGWPVCEAPPLVAVEGTPLHVRLCSPDVIELLTHCIRRYFYEIDDTILPAELTTWVSDRGVEADFGSNRLSGTAVSIKPGWYPIGAVDGLPARDVTVLRDILADCEGVVAWGGDLQPAKHSHLEVVLGPTDPRVAAVAAKLRRWSTRPDKGAGVTVDPFSTARRDRARVVMRAQQRLL